MSFEIIDFHTHPFSTSSDNFCFYNGSVNSDEDFLSDIEAAGISRFAGSVIDKVKKDFSGVTEGNRTTLEIWERYGVLKHLGVRV